jgi:hypothetical protein
MLCKCGCEKEISSISYDKNGTPKFDRFIHGHHKNYCVLPQKDNLCHCGCGQKTKIIKETQHKYGWVKGNYHRFIYGHQRRGKKLSEETKLKMSKSSRHLIHPRHLIEQIAKKTSITLKNKWKTEDYRNKLIGENASNWQGGKSYEIYPKEWNKNIKLYIRNRDKYTCQICGILESCCNRNHAVHHIDYNKKNCEINNLITLCLSCHIKTNVNREYWCNFLLELKESYG